jgi:hypothetical protein
MVAGDGEEGQFEQIVVHATKENCAVPLAVQREIPRCGA